VLANDMVPTNTADYSFGSEAPALKPDFVYPTRWGGPDHVPRRYKE
jgi:hypothetical protein